MASVEGLVYNLALHIIDGSYCNSMKADKIDILSKHVSSTTRTAAPTGDTSEIVLAN